MSLATNAQSLLAGSPEDLDDLAEGDLVVWQVLLEHLVLTTPPAAPAPVVEALLERAPSYQDWLDRAQTAASQCQSDFFITALSAVRPFRQWFASGVVAARPVSDAAGLAAREDLLLHRTGEGVLEEVSALVHEARRPWAGKPELGRLLLVLHRRASEERHHALALESAVEAAALFRALGDEVSARVAQRAQAGAMLRLGQVGPALALLDELMVEEGPLFGGGGAFQLGGAALSARAQAADEAATIASWASSTTPEWVRALGGLAETHVDELWPRFERALTALLKGSKAPADDLAVVLRQAEQRDQQATVARARAVAAKLGVTANDD